MIFGGGAFGRVLMNGNSTLIKKIPESSLNPSAMWGHSEKMTISRPGSRPSPDTKYAGALILTCQPLEL